MNDDRKNAGPPVVRRDAAPEKKEPWKKPEIEELSLKSTRGGFIIVNFEGPYDFLLGS